MFLADTAQDIHLIYLENDLITVNGPEPAGLRRRDRLGHQAPPGRRRGALAGGLFNMELRGTGWVAILSDGPPVLLNVASAPTFADAQAAITWSSGVTVGLKTDFKMKNLIGRGSGESLQLAFQGQGWVLVQPSEGRVPRARPAAAAAGSAACSAAEPAAQTKSRGSSPAVVADGLLARRRTTSARAAACRRRGGAAARRRRRGRPSRPAAAARRPARGRTP